MKFRKFAAVFSAVAMLGSLAVVPANAKSVQVPIFAPTAETSWTLTEANGTATVGGTELSNKNSTATGDSITLKKTDSNTIDDPVQVRTTEKFNFEAGTQYTISGDINYNLTEFTAQSGKYAIYVRVPKEKDGSPNYKDINIVSASSSAEPKTNFSLTYTPEVTTTEWQFQFYLRYALGEVTYSNISVTKTETIAPESVTINTDYDGKTILFNGDSISLSATATYADNSTSSDNIQWTVQRYENSSATELSDAKTTGYTIENNKFTLTNTERDTDGNRKYLMITASIDGVSSEPLTVYVDRSKTASYKVSAGEGATEDDITGVTYKLTINDNEVNTTSSHVYSGYMNAELVLTAPEGFILTVPETSNCYTSVANNGTQIVTVKRDGTNASNTLVGNDFYVEATLSKSAQAHAEAFTFTKTASDFSSAATVKVVFQNDSTDTTKDYSESLGTTFTGQSDALIAVVVTGIQNGYSVKSITIE